jgi:arsenate reductase-like glutaredoxin family protein
MVSSFYSYNKQFLTNKIKMMTYEKYQFIYNSKELNDRKLLAYAQAYQVVFSELDIAKEKVTKSHLAQFCERMEKPLISLLNHHKLVSEFGKDALNLPFEELSKIVVANLGFLNTPFFILGKDYHIINDIADLNKLFKFKAADSSEVFQR